ncbi:MAG: multidrug transporter [Chitinophagaceae bacterium]|nr:MAG: multidrug transporter [Chitinophagaceae bacterium]
MHTGKSYTLKEFIFWTRRRIYTLIILGITPVVLYEVFKWKWIDIPWPVVALLGTATAFIVGFKNTQTYNRTGEAQQIWTSIANLSRAWGMISRDFLNDHEKTRELVLRHLGWLTALRYQMREERVWETVSKIHNKEYRKMYRVPERDGSLETELQQYISREEAVYIQQKNNKAAQILSLQSKSLKDLFDKGQVGASQYLELVKSIKEFYLLQGRSEQIKESPYPRQYAIINIFFVRLFCFLLPFGMLKEFEKLNDMVDGVMKGHMVWLVIPFSVIISWMYTSLEQVGESTENPFEGGANDVPISQISRMIEIDLREMLDETELPLPLKPVNNIVL